MNNKKTLIFYNPSFENGGVERNIINIIENKIINKKYNIILLSIIGKYNNLTISQNKIPNIFNYFVFSRIARYFICSIYLFTYCLTKKCTVISFQNNILAIIITKLTFNKIILRLNTSPEKYINNEISRKFFTFFYKMSDNIVCNSHDFKKSINKFFNIGSVVINNFLNFKKILSLSKKNIPKNFFRNKKK